MAELINVDYVDGERNKGEEDRGQNSPKITGEFVCVSVCLEEGVKVLK